MIKTGDILLTVEKSEVEENMKFLFDVSLNEPRIVDSQPIVELVERLANRVNVIVKAFRPYL